MALPRPLLWVVDPAQAHLDRHRAGRGAERTPARRQAAVYGPGIPGGSRDATEAERVELAARAVRHRRDHEADLAAARRRWGPQLAHAADELLATGVTRIRLGDRTVDARLITFWRGDHLLETMTRGPDGGGGSLSRISRHPRRGGADVLVEYLARAAAKG